ncbi:unnamed protein product [Chrysoparadoxa australica]
MEEEGAADLLLGENAMTEMPRPGTSLNRPKSNAGSSSQSLRPVTSQGRPVTGFLRPGTSSRPITGQTTDVSTAMRGARPGTSRPATSLGREIRLGTASMMAGGELVATLGHCIQTERLDLRKYAERPALAMALVDYLLYVERNPRKALELAAHATVASSYKDWWWKDRLGKCQYKLGLLREAEKQLQSSLKDQDMVVTYLDLVKVYCKLDLPNTALELIKKASDKHPGEARLLLGAARIHEMLNDMEKSVDFYKRVLALEADSVEGIACLGANHFYSDQPEVALRYYRRLLQMGVTNPQLWSNIGLCCFYASQYDMCLSCFERALALANDEEAADIWYNLAQVAIGIGDLGLAFQASKIAVSVDPNHAESYCNLAVLEIRKKDYKAARASLSRAQFLAPYLFEPFYNGALLSYRAGDLQDAYAQCSKALEVYPEHHDSKELLEQLKSHLRAL